MFLDLLPKLNIYRPTSSSDLSLSQYPALNISAVLLSHAIWTTAEYWDAPKDIPIVASPETIVIMKGMQDTASASIEGDTTYVSLRHPEDELGLI